MGAIGLLGKLVNARTSFVSKDMNKRSPICQDQRLCQPPPNLLLMPPEEEPLSPAAACFLSHLVALLTPPGGPDAPEGSFYIYNSTCVYQYEEKTRQEARTGWKERSFSRLKANAAKSSLFCLWVRKANRKGPIEK